jgi:hypothetical protein
MPLEKDKKRALKNAFWTRMYTDKGTDARGYIALEYP